MVDSSTDIDEIVKMWYSLLKIYCSMCRFYMYKRKFNYDII